MQAATPDGPEFDVEVFFDGACPICTREMRAARRLDQRGRVKFTDIAAAEFDAEAYGKTQDEFMRRMQARLPDGSFVDSVEAFRRLYDALGFRRLVALTRAPGLSQLFDFAYAVFAKNRPRMTGRCESDVCAIPPSQRGSQS